MPTKDNTSITRAGEKITRFRDIPKFTDAGSYAVDYPLHYFVRFIEEEVREGGLQLCPEFQRGHVWTPEQQEAYVTFLLRGGKTGRDIYLNSPSWHRSVPEGAYNDYTCVDGLQRITAIQKFIHNDIPVFGSYYRDFTDSLGICETIRVHINDLKTYSEVLQWYIEMNAGGTPHSSEEIERVQELLEKAKKAEQRKATAD